MRVAVEEFQVAGQLFYAVDFAAAFDLDGDCGAVGVAAEDVDRADRGGELAADEGVAVAEGGDVLGEEFLEVCFYAVLLEARVEAQLVAGVVQDLLDGEDEPLA